MKTSPYVTADADTKRRLKEAIATYPSLHAATKGLGLSRGVITTVLAGGSIRQGSLAQIRAVLRTTRLHEKAEKAQ